MRLTSVAYKYAPSYRNPAENTEISWYYMDSSNQFIKKLGDKPEPQDQFGVDHLVELDTIIRFFTDDSRRPGAVTQDQWNVVKEFMGREYGVQILLDWNTRKAVVLTIPCSAKLTSNSPKSAVLRRRRVASLVVWTVSRTLSLLSS